uniref:Replication associated protein n=1 Tax=Porcine associated porprismacovirus TaxID=2496634 RepID=A0A482JU31_9VIRU|nr:replication associated protein [Porcine associated porprismacovirus]
MPYIHLLKFLAVKNSVYNNVHEGYKMVSIVLITAPRGKNDESSPRLARTGIFGTGWAFWRDPEQNFVNVHKRALEIMLEKFDAKRWIIAKECGRSGYEHWQIRAEISGETDDLFSWCQNHGLSCHLEQSTAEWTDKYERKEGRFWTWADSNEILIQRFGDLLPWQKRCLERARTQNDRQIDVWYDPHGNRGKSWLAGAFFERNLACIVPRDWKNPSEALNYICRNYENQGLIMIDIPRATKIGNDLYEIIEMIKDGLISSTKWEGQMRNIRGVKVVVFTNTKLDQEKLSKDRWRWNYI